jgi:filamentous hemagglutinin family protein
LALAAAPTALPVPCIGTSCGATGAAQFVTSGAATAVAAKNSLTITQTTGSAILNWSSFNIGAGGKVTFKQPSSSSIALNRIFQASPSQIFGELTSNGQVYLINLNGFLFGATATVNVGSLLVSSLPLALTDSTFSSGILSPLQLDKPVFDATLDPVVTGGRQYVVDGNGNPVLDANGNKIPVQVVVAPGAQLTSADQGRIFLTGQSVTNGGTLTAPDGQVILAAGTQIYLQADNDPSLRGLIVEVDGTASNSASNQLTGLLSAPRGNITMVGLAVNQDGRISATTSVSANGSIRLEAAGGANAGIGGTLGDQTVASTIGGALTIGPQSQMQITPDTSGGTAVADQTQYASSVTLLGEQVVLQGGSIVAPGGTLTAIAAADPSAAAVVPSPNTAPYTVTGVSNIPDPNARLRVDAGTTINLAGSDQSLPATANLVSAQLRSSELADDPTQRNGPLHGLTVYINALDGSPPIANLSGELAAVPQTIQQRTEDGGHAILQSQGDLVFDPGASINVSGGATTYAGGVLQTSYLVGANGQLYPIETANPLLDYVGVLNPTFTQTYNTWGVQDVVPTPGLSSYQPGYTQGAPAGSVQFAAPIMVLQGSLQGNVTNGLYQRTPATAAAGGQLIIGIPGGVAGATGNLDYLAPAVRLTVSPTPVVVADDESLTGPQTLELPIAYLTGSGFTSTSIYSDGDVMLPAGTPLVLPNGSTLSASAARVDVLSSITDYGGSLTFDNVFNVGSANPSPGERPGVYIGDGVTLNVDGLWTNDELTANKGVTPLVQTWQNGGSINLGVASAGSLLSVGDNVTLHASGGAWLESNGTTVAGTGGSIGLNSAAPNAGLAVGSNLVVDAFGVNGATGGSFSLTAPRIAIGSSSSGDWTHAQDVDDSVTPGGVFDVGSSLFSNYGFQNISLSAVGVVAPGAATSNVITVDAGTTIDAVTSTLLLSQRAPLVASSDTMAGVASVVTRAPYLRSPMDISLTALPLSNPSTPETVGETASGNVAIGIGASLTTDPLGSISLTSLGSIAMDGTLRAPGGSIELHVESPSANDFDSGFIPGQGILLGSTGVIDVSGTFVSTPSSAGLSLGKVDPGGSVSLLADRGTVVTDPGSLISVSGVSAKVDIAQPDGTYGSEIAASDGGSVTVHSGESISLLGNLEARAGAGGTSGAAQAGSLEVDLTRSESWWSVNSVAANASFNPDSLVVELEPTVPSTTPPSAADSNLVALGATQLAQSGLDALRIESGNVVELSGNFSLSLGRQIIIDAPVIAANVGAQASLTAPYLEVGYQLQNGQTPANGNSPELGTGVLSFSGGTIDLLGSTVLQGTSKVTFSSSGDLQLLGNSTGTGSNVSIVGGVTFDGNLTLDAERIYPATATNFTISAVEDPSSGTPGTVTIGQTGADPGTPYSAGGSLAISAYSVASTGTLYAPFGTISLNGTDGITLGDGSLTSVSGGGLTIPYGATQFNGEQWTYNFGSLPQVITGIPSRTVSLNAPSVTLSKQATIDLTGGGDLLAYEWVPGPGGSTDALKPASPGTAAVTPGLYAILPATRGQSAPQDPGLSDSSILPGESVYLSGGGGLAAGTYPLLPARYALLPGAFLIEVEPGYQSTSGGSLGTLASGTPVVAGFLTYGSTGLHQSPGYEGFAVYSGSYAEQLASYTLNLASTFFSAAATSAGEPQPDLPADAGALSIAVTNALDVAGLVRTSAATGGQAGSVDISAADLVVGTPTGTVPADAVSISGAVLGEWQPGSLLLGGVVTSATSGSSASPASSSIDVVANTVTIGSGTTLTAGQIVLVANDSIDVQAGATLQSTSGAAGSALKTLPAVETVTLDGQNPNPSLLAVSDLNWLIPLRAGGSVAAGAGTVNIESGAKIASRGSLTVDGTGGVAIDGTVTGPGAEWSLGSSSIAFVPAGSQADALALDPALVADLGAAGAVRLASTGSIDLLTAVSLGASGGSAPTLDSLTLEASSLNNLTGAGATAAPTAIEFAAKSLTLEGSGALAPAGSAGPTGATLALVANQLNLGPDAVAELGPDNVLAVNGFAATAATVSGPVVAQGTGGLSVNGSLSIASSGITAATASNSAITATGALSVTAASGKNSTATPLGGALTLSGSSISISGAVSAPAGAVTLDSAGAIDLLAGASIGAPGSVVDIQNQSSAAPGGTITIAAGGNVTLDSGATLDVAGAGTAAAGAISLTAGGAATIGGTLAGNGGTGAAGGSFTMNVGSLAAPGTTANALTPLAAALTSGGFNDAINLRVHAGNLELDDGSSLTANTVSLTADSGLVVIGSQSGGAAGSALISAPSGALRGNVAIFGGTGVELESGAVLAANGSSTNGFGGSIEIGAGELVVDATGTLNAYDNAAITLDAGSTISAAGSAGMGTLLLRAPAVVAANPALDGVGITLGSGATLAAITSPGNTTSVGQIVIEPVLPFNTANGSFSSATNPTVADFQNVGTTVSNYMTTAAPNIAAQFGGSGGAPVLVEAGVEIVAPGNLVLPALNLASSGLDWHYNGEPVDLTVRAAGNLEVSGTISDGFGSTQVGTLVQPTLLAGASASIRLVAGADLSSANPLGTTAGGAGNLTIDADKVVRTGTGDIDLVAAGDIVVNGAGSGAYTAGTPAVSPGGSSSNAYPGLASSLGRDLNVGGVTVGLEIPNSNYLLSYPTGGGNLTVEAGGDIENTATTAAGAVTAWQLREGGTSASSADTPTWGINLSAYNWNFGTLGGGDLAIAAGGSAQNVSAAVADSLLPQPAGASLQYVKSGGLSFTAGGDIGSAQVFVADGSGTVTTSGALTATLAGTSGQNVGSAFYLETSTINVTARLGIAVDGIFDPTELTQSSGSASGLIKPLVGSFYSYGDDSSLNLETIAGDIDLGSSQSAIAPLLGNAIYRANQSSDTLGTLPASFGLEALSGNIVLGPGFGLGGAATLFPSPRGQLDLLAAQNIDGGSLTIIMSDAVAGSYQTASTPLATTPVQSEPFAGAIHSGDPNPALVTAGDDIEELGLSIPKAATVVAGQDIVDLTYAGQNLSSSDITLFSAGRDFVYQDTYSGSGTSVGGPGQFDILAGRNILLGFSDGVVTTGDLLNANLPTPQGASITMVTGLGTAPDISGDGSTGDKGFLGSIIAPSSAYQTELENYVETLEGTSGLSFAKAEAAFEALPLSEQLPLIDSVFFNELSLSGLAETTVPGAGFAEGYAAINALFPGSGADGATPVAGAYAGNLTLEYSQIYTLSGGDINLVVPGGEIDVGLAVPPATQTAKAPSSLGIVTEEAGNIDIYSQGDVNVNSSRIFTLGGGNILIWSDLGSIDAGLGAKTSVSAPPPSILINSNGTVTLNFAGAATGSGIRTIQTEPTTPPGDVDLIAPVGTVNAGDAGIGAAGNINIAARSVLGVSNISFGGSATGVPAQVSSVSASLSGAANAASGTTNTATSSVSSEAAESAQTTPLAQNALSWLDVFITGLGEENCKQDDIECLKRQKKPTP